LANLDTKSSGKVGTYAMTYYFSTTLIAVFLGIILVVLIHPGNPKIKENMKTDANKVQLPKDQGGSIDAFLDLIRQVTFPPPPAALLVYLSTVSFHNNNRCNMEEE
ncbi:hypothetical protein Ciccas_012980, partial [Cichlidogyrus casuarinus]